MPTLKISRTINASSAEIWVVLSDYNNIQVFHPLVEHVDQLSEVDRGPGAKRRCNFYDGSSAVEEVTEWKEGQSFTVVVTEAPMPVVNVTATMGIDKIDSRHSQVYLEMRYTPKWGIFGKILNVLMLRMAMRQVFNKVLKGLQLHIETGETVGKNGKPVSQISQTKTTQLQQG